MARVKVIREADQKVFKGVGRKTAVDLVARGYAEVIDERTIRLFQKKAAISSGCATSRQGSAYFSAAIDSSPRFVQGGLTRDEHKPAQISPYAGARVGH